MQNKTLAEISYRADLISTRSIESLTKQLKNLHARNSAKGCLKSGATIRESSLIARNLIQGYFAELEKFIREYPNGEDGADGLILTAVSSSTSSLITSINHQLKATAELAGDASLVQHLEPEIFKELSASQELFRSNLRAYWSKNSTEKLHRIIYLLEVISFIAMLVFVFLWLIYPSKNYEPYAALFGLTSVASDLFRRSKWLQ